MANRIVIQADIDAYAIQMSGCNTQMFLGDIILNTRTATAGDGKGAVFYSAIATTFAGARTGATVWIDGDALGVIYDFRFTNGGGGVEFAISSEDNPVHIRPIWNTQLKMVRNSSSNGGYTFLCLDLKYLVIDGENDLFPGMRDGVGTHHKFLRGSFGFWASGGLKLESTHMFSLGVVDGGSLTIRGIEAEHGFSAIRFNGNNNDWSTDFTAERVYLHDAVDGEGFYIGATHGPPLVKMRRLNIRDVIISRRAAESIQIQHLLENAERAVVENFQIHAGDSRWISEFQPGQDSCIQWSVDQGNNYIQNGVIDGYASVGLVVYGSNQAVPDSNVPAVIQNCVFNDARGIFLFINVSTTQGMRWVYRKIYLTNFNNTYYSETGEPLQDYYVGSNNGTDKHQFQQIYYDGIGKTNVFQNSAGFDLLKIEQKNDLGAIQYVNSGWYEPAERIQQWFEFYADYFDGSNGTPVHWLVGDIAINCIEDLEYRFYKCLIEHTSTTLLMPHLAYTGATPTWKILSWDTNGTRNDQPTWLSGVTQSDYPPDDFRLVADNEWNLKGMGLCSNIQNTLYTQYQWFRSNSPVGINAVPIPNGKTLEYTPQFCDIGKYLTIGVKVKNKNGIVGEWVYGDWEQVTL